MSIIQMESPEEVLSITQQWLDNIVEEIQNKPVLSHADNAIYSEVLDLLDTFPLRTMVFLQGEVVNDNDVDNVTLH